MKRVLLTLATAALALGVVSTPAHAAAPRDQGWWTATNPIPAPPDVPPRGLLVQAGPNGPSAFAAVLYELEQGTTAGMLTLAIAPNSLSTPSATLMVCPLLQAIVHPEQGGPMSNAPPYDCSRKATAAPTGTNYQFDASGLVTDRLVAVAILPNGPVDRVVLDAPDANSLATQAGLTDTAAPPADFSTGIAPTESPVPVADVAPGFTEAGSAPSFDVALPGVSNTGPSSVAPAPAAAPAGSSDAGGTFLPALSEGPEDATPLLVILLVIGTIGAGALWFYAGRETEPTVAV
jgi:hypothetical protein